MFPPSSTADDAAARHAVEEALSGLAALDPDSIQRPEMAEHLTGLYRLRAVLDAAIVDAVGVFDGRKDWSYDGAFTASGWIAARTQTSRSAASATVATARQARHMDVAMAEARTGGLTFDQVRILAAARGVSDTTAKEYDDDENRLVSRVKDCSIEGAARLMRRWAAAADPDADDEKHKDREKQRKVNLSTSLDGVGFLDGLMTAEANAVLRAQLESITDDLHRWGLSSDADGHRLTAAQLRHDALVEMARRAQASATAVDVRRDAKARAEQAVAERRALADASEGEAPGDQPGAAPTTSDDGEPDPQDPSGPQPAGDDDAHDEPAPDDASTANPGPTGGSDPRGPDPQGLDQLARLSEGSDPDPDRHTPDDDPPPPGPGDCSDQTAAQGLLLPPGTGPPATGPPDDKVAGGLGRPLFNVLIDLHTLEDRQPTDLLAVTAEVIGIGPLPRDTIRRHLCDAGISRIVTRGTSLPLDVGAVSRTATPAQWRALITHTDTCEFPGCTAPWEWTQAHHMDHWTNTHTTALDDLALECTGHHHLLHQPGWKMRRNADLSITVTRPDGTTLHAPRHQPRAEPRR